MEYYEKHLNSPLNYRLLGKNCCFTINIYNYMIFKEINELILLLKNQTFKDNEENEKKKINEIIDDFIETFNPNKLSINNYEDNILIQCIINDNYNIIISFENNFYHNASIMGNIIQKYNLYDNMLYEEFINNIINKFKNDEIDRLIKISENKLEHKELQIIKNNIEIINNIILVK